RTRSGPPGRRWGRSWSSPDPPRDVSGARRSSTRSRGSATGARAPTSSGRSTASAARCWPSRSGWRRARRPSADGIVSALMVRKRIGVFGAGYAGLVTGVGFAELGHTVLVRDVVPEKIDSLAAGQAPFHEPGLEELLARNRERLRFTLDAADVARDTDFFFICVGTPATYAGDADLSAVWTVLDELPRVDRRAILV